MKILLRCDYASIALRVHGDVATYPPPPPFHWTTIPLRSWRSRIFSKIIPNRRGSVDSHTILELDAVSTLPLRFYYASTTLLLRSHYDNEDLVTLSLRWWWCSWDLTTCTTLAIELRFRCAFVSFLYGIWNSDTLLQRPGRFYCALAVSATIRVILTKISNRSGIAIQWNGGGGGVKFWAGYTSRREVAIMKTPIRFYYMYDLGASTALLPFLLKFRIVAESPSSGMGVLLWACVQQMYNFACAPMENSDQPANQNLQWVLYW